MIRITTLWRPLFGGRRHQPPTITRSNGLDRQGVVQLPVDPRRHHHFEALIAVPADELVQSIFVFWNRIAPLRSGRVAGRPYFDAVFTVTLSRGDGGKPLSCRRVHRRGVKSDVAFR